jgi:pre-mRNA-splicing factor 18
MCGLWCGQRLLREWELELDARSDEEKRSAKGKIASATQKQTRQYVKPLLKLLKDRTVSDDILRATERIATLCRQREYVKANEEYLTLVPPIPPLPLCCAVLCCADVSGAGHW